MNRSKGTEYIEPRESLQRVEEYVEGADEGYAGVIKLMTRQLLVHSKTPCGVWVYLQGFPAWKGKLKFVNLKLLKKYASETKTEAMVSFKARKRRQIAILDWQIKQARAGYKLAVNGEESSGEGWYQ